MTYLYLAYIIAHVAWSSFSLVFRSDDTGSIGSEVHVAFVLALLMLTMFQNGATSV